MPGTVPVQLECRVSVDMLCRQAVKPVRARSQKAQVFIESLWRVCIGCDGANCASRITDHSHRG